MAMMTALPCVSSSPACSIKAASAVLLIATRCCLFASRATRSASTFSSSSLPALGVQPGLLYCRGLVDFGLPDRLRFALRVFLCQPGNSILACSARASASLAAFSAASSAGLGLHGLAFLLGPTDFAAGYARIALCLLFGGQLGL